MTSPTVYMLQENPEWTAPLKTELRRIGTPIGTWNLATRQLPLATTPTRGIFLQQDECIRAVIAPRPNTLQLHFTGSRGMTP